jgi:chemotaxis signal transduction protein
MSRAFLPFEIEGNAFLIETSRVREILGGQSLTRIPHASRRLPGVFAHKGLAIPVIDLAVVLELTAPTRSSDQSTEDRRRTIVIKVGEDVAALVADEVWEVAQVAEKDLKDVRVAPRPFAQAEVQWSQQIATIIDVVAMMHACMQSEGGS